jgi:hypothetical protein
MQFSLSLQPKQTKYQFEMKGFYQRRLFVNDGSIENAILMLPEVPNFEIIRVWIPNSITIMKFIPSRIVRNLC